MDEEDDGPPLRRLHKVFAERALASSSFCGARCLVADACRSWQSRAADRDGDLRAGF